MPPSPTILTDLCHGLPQVWLQHVQLSPHMHTDAHMHQDHVKKELSVGGDTIMGFSDCKQGVKFGTTPFCIKDACSTARILWCIQALQMREWVFQGGVQRCTFHPAVISFWIPAHSSMDVQTGSLTCMPSSHWKEPVLGTGAEPSGAG